VALTTAQVASLTTGQVAALTTLQAVAIENADIAAIKTSQITSLSTANVNVLGTGQIQAITTGGIAALTTGQAFALTTANVVALTTAQVAALSTASLNAFSTGQIRAIETVDVAALKTSQVAALSTANLVALSTDQIGAFTSAQSFALTTTQVEALTSAQIGAFSTVPVGGVSATQALHLGTPLVLDLNGDGVKTRSISEGTTFDLFANGNKVNTGWVSASDGLLVLDRNHDGAVNDGSELFGSATTLSNGTKAADGYAALRDLDSNADGVIDAKDAAFADLKVWVDANSDGVTETGELKTLQDLGISSISAQATVDPSKDNGNYIGLTSTYQTTDGATHAAADVWFVADANQQGAASTPVAAPVDSAIASINSNLPVLTDIAGPTAAASPPPATPTASDLRTQVSGMAQALSAFTAADPASGGTAAGALAQPGSAPTPTALAVSSMVSAMQQFDANGNLLKPLAPSAAPLAGALNVAGTQVPAGTGLLASPTGKLPGA
jgi:hypothetical protein